MTRCRRTLKAPKVHNKVSITMHNKEVSNNIKNTQQGGVEKKQEYITNRQQRITRPYNKKPLKNTRNAHQGKIEK